MSRTKRRLGARHHYAWVLRDWVWHGNGFLVRGSLDPRSIEGRKLLARYHSDAGFGDYQHKSPPHWYRRWLNKRADNEEQRELYRWHKNQEHEVPSRRRAKDASWFW
jgi:hypothetical protein